MHSETAQANQNLEKSWSIRFEDLSVGWGDTPVLTDLNLEMPGGQINMILGGSGCGKSTLLRHILGLNRPMRGSIYLGGHNLFELPRRRFSLLRRRMGVLFQDGALLGSLTLEENVALPLKEHNLFNKAKIKEIVLHKLSLVGLADFADYYPNQLSGGMRKRAGLARALATDPPVLLCDEPTSGLDPINAAQMDELLRDMNQRLGATIVVVSHDLGSLFNIADRAIVLHERRAIYNGPPDDLKTSDDPYLRRFLNRKATV